MNASVMHEFGGPAVLKWESIAAPAAQADEIVIKVHAVTVNRTLDLAVRAGKYGRPVRLPHILGADPAGEVVAVGSQVRGRRVGDRVVVAPVLRPSTDTAPPTLLGVSVWGGYAEYVAVPASATFLIPDGLPFDTAAVIARHAPMALHLLETKARLARGQWVLVMGASGGLGQAGIQIAKWLGATVIAGAGAPARTAAALLAGADHAIDYRAGSLEAEIAKITDGRGVDVVFENIGDPGLFPAAMASLARGGRLVTAGSHGGGIVPLNVTLLYQRQLSIFGSTGQTGPDMQQALRLAADGILGADIVRRWPLSEAAKAHEALESGEVTGKVVLYVPD